MIAAWEIFFVLNATSPFSLLPQWAIFAWNMFGKRIGTSPNLLVLQGISGFVLIITYGHTFATIALQNGVDIKTVSGMLGHYSAGFTLDTYAHVTTAAQREAARTMGSVLSDSLRP